MPRKGGGRLCSRRGRARRIFFFLNFFFSSSFPRVPRCGKESRRGESSCGNAWGRVVVGVSVASAGAGMGLGLAAGRRPQPLSVGPPSIPRSHYRWVELCPSRGGGTSSRCSDIGEGGGRGGRAGSAACHQSPAKRQWEKAKADKTKGVIPLPVPSCVPPSRVTRSVASLKFRRKTER